MKQGKFRLAAVCSATAALATAGVAFGATGANAARPAARASAHAASMACGMGNGKKATGTPIRLGAIATNQPGTSFMDNPDAAQAFFNCVNANGGVHGHPIQYFIEQEQTNPPQVAADAVRLVQTDKVLGIVGSMSLIDCTVNANYYKQKHFNIITSGIAPQCFASSFAAAPNMGPRYSSDGAAAYVIAHGAKKIVFDQENVPGTGYNVGGVQLIGKAKHIPVVALTENAPIQDGSSVALKEVQAAGPGGAVVLNMRPPDALVVLQAAQKLGLENKVMWACSTPCNTDFLASALGPAWNGHLHVNAELNLTSANGPDSKLYRNVMAKYGKGIALGSFSQMGFLSAQIAVSALMTIKGPYTTTSVNQSFVNVKNFKTDLLCRPWYYQNLPVHLPNTVDWTVTPHNGKMVIEQGCTPIPTIDPEVKYIRGIEKKYNL